MALSSAVALFRLHLINANLLALAVLDDICGDACAFDNGSTENGIFLVDDCQNTVELNRLACLDIKLLNEDDIALSNTVLLAAGLDYSVLHELNYPFFRSRSHRCRADPELPTHSMRL